MKSIFSATTWKWWQLKTLGIGLVFLGASVGIYWADFFEKYLLYILVIGVVFYLAGIRTWMNEILKK